MNLTESQALIIAAIISLIGVSYAAYKNYRSNWKINEMKIKHEEEKLKRVFLQDSFDNLRKAAKALQQLYRN